MLGFHKVVVVSSPTKRLLEYLGQNPMPWNADPTFGPAAPQHQVLDPCHGDFTAGRDWPTSWGAMPRRVVLTASRIGQVQKLGIGPGEELSMDQRDRFLGNPENPFGSFYYKLWRSWTFSRKHQFRRVCKPWLARCSAVFECQIPKKTILKSLGSSHPSKIDEILKIGDTPEKKFKMAVPIYPCLTLCLKIRLLIKHPSLCCETCNSADGSTGCVSACVRITWISWACSGYDGIS